MAEDVVTAPEVVVPSKPDKQPEYTTIDGKTLGLDYPLRFPKDWSPSKMRAAVGKEYPQLKPEMLRLAIPDPERTTGEKVKRAVGLAARDVLTSNPITAGALLGGNLLSGTVNDVKRGFNWAVGRDTESNLPFQESTGDRFQRLLSSAGLPAPEDDKERLVSAIQSGAIGAVGGQFLASRAGQANPLPPGAMRGGPGPGATAPARPLAPTQGPIASQLAEAPLQQGITGAAGGAAAGVAANQGYGPVGQAVAGAVGGLAGSPRAFLNAGNEAPFVGQHLPALGERPDLPFPMTRQDLAQKNQADFAQAGVNRPSAGEITQAPILQAAESVVSHMPGSFDVMKRNARTQQSDLGAKANAIVDELVKTRIDANGKVVVPSGQNISPAKASRIIDRGLNGDTEGWRDRFQRSQNDLYLEAKDLLPPSTTGRPSNYQEILNKLTTINPREKNMTGRLVNAEIQQLKDDLEADLAAQSPQSLPQSVGNARINTGGPRVWPPQPQAAPAAAPAGYGRVSYETLFKTRQDIGEKLRNPSDTRNTGQLREVYKALTKDMELMALEQDVNAGKTTGPGAALVVAAHNAGNPITDAVLQQAKLQGGPAVDKLDRANLFTRVGWKRMDEVIEGAKGPGADIYHYATELPEMDSGNRIARVMHSLNPDQRDAVKAQFIRNMGLAKPGVQNVEGDIWSSRTFLTNYNKMGKVAKGIMFAGMDGQMRSDLDAIARASYVIEVGSDVFKNPSGTGRVVSAATQAGAMGVGVLTLNPAMVGTVIGGLALQRVGAHLMFNPTFVNWLATSARKPSGALPAQLSFLSQQFAKGDPQTRQEVENYIAGVRANMGAVQGQKEQSPSHFFTLKSMPTED